MARSDPPVLKPLLFQVPDLVLDRPWSVGAVEFLPAGSAKGLVDAARTERGWRHDWYDDHLDEAEVPDFDAVALARVEAVDGRLGYDLAADAVGVLRLFAAVRSPMANTQWQTFGLAGQARSWSVRYFDISQPSVGRFRGGPVPGWTFTEQDHAAFSSSQGFQFLASCVQGSVFDLSPIQRRLLLGLRLLNSSILDYNADRKLLSMVTALEVVLAETDWQGKKYGIARRAAFLSCSVPQGSMCGRDRPSCPYLAYDPSQKVPDALKALVERSKVDDSVLCSHYRFPFDLYGHRNDAIHQGTSRLAFDDVVRAGWEVSQWLVPPLLEWCARHPDEDIGAIDAEIEATVLANPPDYELD